MFSLDLKQFIRNQAPKERTAYDDVSDFFNNPLHKVPLYKTKDKIIESYKDNDYDTIGNVNRKLAQLTQYNVVQDKENVKPVVFESKSKKDLINDMINNKSSIYNGYVIHNPVYNTQPKNKKALKAMAVSMESRDDNFSEITSSHIGSDLGDNEDNNKLVEHVKEEHAAKTIQKVVRAKIAKKNEVEKLKGIEKAKIEKKAGNLLNNIVENAMNQATDREIAAKTLQSGIRRRFAINKTNKEKDRLTNEEKLEIKVRGSNLNIKKGSKSLNTGLDTGLEASQAITKPHGTTSKEGLTGGDLPLSMDYLIKNNQLPTVTKPITSLKGAENTINDALKSSGSVSLQKLSNLRPFLENLSKDDFTTLKSLFKEQNIKIKTVEDIYKHLLGDPKIKK